MKQYQVTVVATRYEISDATRISYETGEVITVKNANLRIYFAEGATVPYIKGDGTFSRAEAKSLLFSTKYAMPAIKRGNVLFDILPEMNFQQLSARCINAEIDILVTEQEKGEKYTDGEGVEGVLQGDRITHSIIAVRPTDAAVKRLEALAEKLADAADNAVLGL